MWLRFCHLTTYRKKKDVEHSSDISFREWKSENALLYCIGMVKVVLNMTIYFSRALHPSKLDIAKEQGILLIWNLDIGYYPLKIPRAEVTKCD